MENNKRICVVIDNTRSTAEVQKLLASLGGKIEIISQADADKQGFALSIPEDKGAEIPFGLPPLIIHAPPPPLLLNSPLSYLSTKNKKQRRKGGAGVGEINKIFSN